MNKKQLIPAILSMSLLACAAKPTHVVVAPVMPPSNAITYDRANAQLKVTDLRTNKNVVQVLRKGEAAELYPSQADLAKTVTKALKEAYNASDLNIKQSPNSIAITIESAQVIVEQGAVSYVAKTEISLRAVADNKKFQVSKKFKATASTEGALTADIATLERDFNTQLGKVLAQIVQSNELKDVFY